MDQVQYELAINLFTCLLSRLMPPSLPEELFIKTTYKLYAGFKAVDRDGNRLALYPVGPDLRWLIEAITREASKKNFFFGDANPIKAIEYTGESFDLLIDAALQDPIALEATKELVNDLREQKKKLPTALQKFINDLFVGKIKPKNYSKNRLPHFHRNLSIIMCITALKNKNFGPISKSSSDYTWSLTLCDAMSIALQKMNIHLSCAAISTIWKNRKHSKKFTDRFPIHISDENVIEIGFCESFIFS